MWVTVIFQEEESPELENELVKELSQIYISQQNAS